MEKQSIRSLKKGEYFRLKDSDQSPVWVRGEYIPELKKYSIHKFDDVNHEAFKQGDTVVYTDFIF